MPRQRLFAELLQLMPLYRDIQDLSIWEFVLQQVVDDGDDSQISNLFWAIFEFGRCNLYGKFNPDIVSAEYSRLQQLFSENGLSTPKQVDFQDY